MNQKNYFTRNLNFLIAGLLLFAYGCSSPPEITDLTLVNNPNERVPLAGILSFNSDKPVVATITLDDGENQQSITPDDTPKTSFTIPVLGMRPDKEYNVILSIHEDQGEEITVDTLSIKTPPLPEDFPPITLTTSEKESLEPGVTLLNLFRWTGPFDDDSDWGLLVALDSDGEVVWYYQTDYGIGEGRRLQNGNLFFGGEIDGRMYEIDMLGNIQQEWHTAGAIIKPVADESLPVDTDNFHHDIIQMPSGNFLGLGLEVIEFEDFPIEYPPSTKRGKVNVASDVLIEFAPDGSTVRKWSVANILDPERLGTGSLGTDFYEKVYEKRYDSLSLPIDITHSNAIYYDESSDAAIVSSYQQCVIYKVDMKTGELIWLLGDSYGWDEPWADKLLKPVGDLTWPCHQHGLELTPRGTLLLFDNGAGRNVAGQPGLTPDEMYSRAVEYKIDEENGTVEQVWTYGPEQEHFSSVFICDADYMMETGNVLITDGGRFIDEDGNPMNTFGGHQWGRVFEVTYGDDPKKIWEIVIKDPEKRFSIYRAQRLKSLYPKHDRPIG